MPPLALITGASSGRSPNPASRYPAEAARA